ncbi:MAG: NADH-quinone oxidoreductase subunit A [Thermoguttaceae bacterium]
MMSTAIVAYLTLFVTVGVLFLAIALLLGRFLRPNVPSAEKLSPYECGELPVGSSFVQYNLRFYVVALLFIVFEVELAFFFPPAVVFGKLTQLITLNSPQLATSAAKIAPDNQPLEANPLVMEIFQKLGVNQPDVQIPEKASENLATPTRALALAAMIDMGLFFAILMVGFAYLWKRGDLEWIRGTQKAERRMQNEAGSGEVGK